MRLGVRPFVLLAAAACSESFGSLSSTDRLVVQLDPNTNTGSPNERLAPPIDTSSTFVVNIAAKRGDGSPNTGFSGYVRLGVRPGSVQSLAGTGVSGRNVKLVAGVAQDIAVTIVGAFGDTFIVAEDSGYVPADPLGRKAPQCADGVDNDADGRVDFEADPGCAFANDDSEEGGNFIAGASERIFFALPRIADVRGVLTGGSGTPFPKQQVLLDTGYRDESNSFAFNTVVTRIAADGFYATDLDDPRGFSSIFAFNFNAPARMRVCDRLKSFGGTASDFFGFTEITFPTWTLEEWDPREPLKRPCLVPEPTLLTVTALNKYDRDRDLYTNAVDELFLQNHVSGLVRVGTQDGQKARVSSHFGPNKPAPPVQGQPPETGYIPSDEATNCDLNDDGKVDRSNANEKACADHCDKDLECSEFSNFSARSAFRIVVSDAAGVAGAIQANGTTAAAFNALSLRGKELRAFTGTLRFFSGGRQYTIEARCADDIVLDMAKSPLPSDKACVNPRTTLDNNAGSN